MSWEKKKKKIFSPMEETHYFPQKKENPDFNLREWTVKAPISRANSISRRFSGSYITSFREDGGSFRSDFTIFSTSSSPGYPLRDEIDPATYSFTTALEALQGKSCYNIWEYLSPEGFVLNSKWNEAEKYICNPLSGEVPLECLSAKTLSGRSFRNLTNRITMSAPLVYSTNPRQIQTKPEDGIHHFPKPGMSKDVGTQSTAAKLSSKSLSPTSTPPIVERALKRCELEAEEEGKKETVKEDRKGGEDETERVWRQSGCLSWMRKRKREKQKARERKFLSGFKGC